MTSNWHNTALVFALALSGFCCFLLSQSAYAQKTNPSDTLSTEYDSLLNDYLLFDSLLLDELTSDSTSFFQMLDDLMDGKYIKSSVNLRVGYSGKISNAGRTLGIDQYGFSAGASYYHKSGVFVDASSFWNSDQVPSTNTIILGAGYMGNFTTNWSYWGSYEHYFYTTQEDDSLSYFPFTNALNASTLYYLKKFGFGLDYSFTFGEENAHRIRANIGYNISIKDWWVFDRISINPNISMLLGNASVITWTLDIDRTKELIQTYGWRWFRNLKNNNPALLAAYLASPVDSNEFGIMNYSFFVPLSLSKDKFTLMVNYTLNKPVALPGESLDTSFNNYLSTTLMYTF
ncbi:MAG: hypothetical protein KDC79_16045 [Cyclobacteriaceae bacterium]|nr:hypothetical protein [Cyclobacteriaceae bacterium]